MLQSLDVSAVSAHLATTPFLYIGVVSFERRATAWLQSLVARSIQPKRAVIFDYDTIAEPFVEDRELRTSSKQDFERLLQRSDLAFIQGMNAFAINILQAATESEVNNDISKTILIDITCMTRVHLFAAVAVATRAEASGKRVIYCYSAAHSYGLAKQDMHGWRDVLFVAASGSQGLGGDVRAHGIISAGHDGERLSVALQELEPPSGVFIYPTNAKRPDFTARAMMANETVQRRLSILRSPKGPGGVDGTDRWHFEKVEVDDFQALAQRVQEQLDLATTTGGVVAIYPFGPKPMTLCIADRVRRALVPAWVVYPVPDRFSVSYSSGSGSLSAFGSR